MLTKIYRATISSWGGAGLLRLLVINKIGRRTCPYKLAGADALTFDTYK